MLDRLTTRTISNTPHPHNKNNLLADTELGQIMPDHLRLNLHLIELLARVHAHHAANHLRHDDHVAEVRLHGFGLLIRLGLLLRFAQLLDQTHRLALEAAVEAAAGTSVDDVAELFGGEVEESVWLVRLVGSLVWRVGL